MRKKLFGSFGFVSVLVATTLVGFDTQIAMACPGGASSSSGLSHGSSLGSGSVTVCVGSSTGSPSSSTTQTITKTVTVKVPAKAAVKVSAKPAPAPAPKKVSPVAKKPQPKPVVSVPVSCPSPSQLTGMPRSADAAERWVQSVCAPATKTVSAPKPAPKPESKSTTKTKTKTITETITIEIPGYQASSADAVKFYPNPLRAAMFPAKLLAVGQVANFSSNPAAHFGVGTVLGRQAQVHFVPVASGWTFSDGGGAAGADTARSFDAAGGYQALAFVRYRVSYRVLGESDWKAVAGELTVESEVLELEVGASYLRADPREGGALLVGSDCKANPLAYGCNI